MNERMLGGLEPKTVLINKYSHARLRVVRYNPTLNNYDCARISDGKKITVGRQWQSFYDIEVQVPV